jgi:hypothetical protein
MKILGHNHDAMDDAEPFPSHSQGETDAFVEHSPDHEHARTASPMFEHNRHELVVNRNYTCFYADKNCDHMHPVEAHHEFLEYSKKDAIDLELFRARHQYVNNPQNGLPLLPAIDRAIAANDPLLLCDDIANLVIYCKVHHVGPGVGKHHAPDPLVRLTGLGKDGYIFLEAGQKHV